MKIQIFSRQFFLFKIKIGKRISVYFVCVRDLWLLTKLVVNHSAMALQIRRNYVQHTTVLIIVLIKSHNLFVRVLLSPVIPTILWWTLVDGVPYTHRLNNVTKQIIMRIIANYKCAYDIYICSRSFTFLSHACQSIRFYTNSKDFPASFGSW